MPIYEYECRVCRSRFEKKQGFDAQPVCACPDCQGESHRLFHSVGIIYKGGGFYTTDSRGSGFSPGDKTASEAGKDKASSDAKAEGKSEAKSETKPETKSEAKSGAKS